MVVLVMLLFLLFSYLFRYGYKAREHFVNWFAWFVKNRSFGELLALAIVYSFPS